MEHRWGRFVNLQPLGQGGMGAVYRAFDPVAKREVALKALRAGAQATPAQAERLRREAVVLARLQHRYLLPVYGLERGDDGSAVLVGPLVQGENLQERLDRLGPLAAGEAAALVRKIAEGVAHAHGAEVLHRDIKPANVLLSEETPEPLLADFGIARIGGEGQSLTVTGQWLGTPGYMAPEQGLGQPVGEAADVYGLGALLFACLTAAAPRNPESLMELLDEFVRGQPPEAPSQVAGSSADASLDAICRRAMASDPAQRYAGAGALAAALRGYEAGERRGGATRLRRALIAAAGVALVGLAAAGIARAGRTRDAGAAEGASSLAPSAPNLTPDPTPGADDDATREAWLQRINRREEREDHAGVLAAARELLQGDPQDVEAGFWEARALAQLGRYPESFRVLERFLALFPEAGLFVYQRGDTHERTIPQVGLELGRAKALADYGRAMELGLPRRWEREARIARAGLLRDAGRWEEAKADYGWLADDAPDATRHLINLGYISARQDRPSEALAFFNAALAIDPDEPDALLNRAMNYQGAGRNDQALADLRRVLQREASLVPTQAAQARHQLAGVHFLRGELDMAIESARESVRYAGAITAITDRSQYWLVLAQLLRRAGRPREALEVLEDFLSLSPDHLATLRASYELRLEEGDLEGCASAYQRVREHHPNSTEADLMAAELLAETEPATALAHCERALQIALPVDDAIRLRVLCAKLYLGASRPRDALIALDPLLVYLDGVVLPTRLELLWLQAQALAGSGRGDEAKQTASRFLREAPPSDPRRAPAKALRGH